MVPRWQIFDVFWRPVFAASRIQHVSDLHLKFPKATPCVEVWQTSNLRRLRLGEEKKERKIEEEEETTGRKYNGLLYSIGRP